MVVSRDQEGATRRSPAGDRVRRGALVVAAAFVCAGAWGATAPAQDVAARFVSVAAGPTHTCAGSETRYDRQANVSQVAAATADVYPQACVTASWRVASVALAFARRRTAL